MLRRFFLAGLVALGLSSPASAQMLQAIVNANSASVPPSGTQQVFAVTTNNAMSGAANRFFPIAYGIGAFQSSDFPSLTMPVAGTFKNLRVATVTAPTGAQQFVFTVNKNGSSTLLTCTINSGAGGICSDLSDTVTVAAGDYLDIQSTPSGSPTATIVRASLTFVPTNANDTVVPARGASFSTASEQAAFVYADTGVTSVAGATEAIFPEGGTLDKYYVTSTAPGAGTSYAFGIAVNGTAAGTPSNFAIPVSGTGTTGNDTTDTASVTAGQHVSFTATPTGTPASATVSFGARFTPTTAGDFIFLGNLALVNDSATVTEYYGLSGTASATEANAQNIVNAMTVTQMVVNVNTAPGTGNSRSFTLNDNGVSTGLSCSIANTATNCTATGTITVNGGDLIDISDVPTGSPGAHLPLFGVIAH